MKNAAKYLFILSLLTTIVYGCKKGGNTPASIPDTTLPTISITKPTAGQAFVPGNTITFQAAFADNEKLASYELAITKVIASGIIPKNVQVYEPWAFTKASTSFSSGIKQADVNLDIPIPLLNDNSTSITTGKYNFKVTCLDGAGNKNETTIEININ